MFKREFKINLKGLLLWTSILLLVYILIFSIYPSLMNEDTVVMMKQVISSMPQEMLSVFNMDIVGIESAFGWFRTEGVVFLLLVGGLYSAILGSTILVKEESDKTIEFLYSKPITRNKIITSKIICGVINILLFTGIIAIGNYIALFGGEDFNTKQFFMISLIPILLYYMLFFVSMFISTFFRKTRKSMSIGIALAFGMYIMQIIGAMGESLEFLKNISFFEFVSSRYIIINNALNMNYLWVGIFVIIFSIICIYVRYNQKEFI